MPSETYEQTLILLKPDAVRRNLTDEIEAMFARNGLIIVHRRWHTPAIKETIEEHYQEHKDQPYFHPTVKFMTSGPLVALVIQGTEAIRRSRELIGHRDPEVARSQNPDSIRAKFGERIEENLVHVSDSQKSADRELRLWFPELFRSQPTT